MSEYMVSIGHWGQPSVVELQARTIRANCGDVPILVSDDHSETCFDPEKGTGPDRGQAIKARLIEVCRREGLILVDTAPERIGHAGGDLGAFYHGLQHARDHGIEYVWKLSQRFMIDIPNWLSATVRSMRKFDSVVACRPCFYGSRPLFSFRTECIGLRVAEWSQPDLLQSLNPRPLRDAAEHLIEECFARISGGRPSFAPSWLPQDRLKRADGIAWKDALLKEETDADYAKMAAKYGVNLGDDFNTHHSIHQHGFLWG